MITNDPVAALASLARSACFIHISVILTDDDDCTGEFSLLAVTGKQRTAATRQDLGEAILALAGMEETHRCSRCGREKKISLFLPDYAQINGDKDRGERGRKWWCLDCSRVAAMESKQKAKRRCKTCSLRGLLSPDPNGSEPSGSRPSR